MFRYVHIGSRLKVPFIMAGAVTLAVFGTLIFLGIDKFIGFLVKQGVESFFYAAADKIF